MKQQLSVDTYYSDIFDTKGQTHILPQLELFIETLLLKKSCTAKPEKMNIVGSWKHPDVVMESHLKVMELYISAVVDRGQLSHRQSSVVFVRLATLLSCESGSDYTDMWHSMTHCQHERERQRD